MKEPGLSKEQLEADVKVGENVVRELATRTLAFQEAVAETLGISLNDHRCLELVDRFSEQGPVTAGKLAELTGLTTGAITGVLDRLERAGFVRREKGAEDRRQVQIKLIDERKEEVGALFEDMGAAFERLCAEHSANELAKIWEFMRRLSVIHRHEAEALRARAEGGAAAARAEELSAPLARSKGGRFEIARGAANLTLGSLRGEQLYRVRYEGPAPRIRADDGHVLLEYKHAALRIFSLAKQALQVDLNEGIPWELVLRGGASRVSANLKALQLRSLEIRGGASHVRLLLPPPSGTVSLRVTGGSSHLTVLRPRNSAARVQVTGGVSQLNIDKLELGAVGGTTRWQSPDYDADSDRYEIQISGGASQLSIGQE